MEHEKCYAFHLDGSRPVKKRRCIAQGLQASWEIRNKEYQATWRSQRLLIDEALRKIHAATTSEIALFLDDARQSKALSIPTGLILSGPGSASQSSVVRQLSEKLGAKGRTSLVNIDSASAPNLKGALKTLIQRVTSTPTSFDEDDEDIADSSRNGPRLLNYDLQILHDYVQDRKVQQVVILFSDTEAFGNGILSELIELLGSWRDRIPTVCLFSVATSVEFLQQRLSRSAIQYLDGKTFDAAPSREELARVFSILTEPGASIWMGPSLLASALERENDYIQNIESLVDAVQYAYMCCFYANALSIFCCHGLEFRSVPNDHFQALRNLESLHKFVERLVNDGETDYARRLLESDTDLFDLVKQKIDTGRVHLQNLTTTTQVIHTIQGCLPNTQASSRTTLYLQAMQGKLCDSALIRSLLLTIRKSSAPAVLKIMQEVTPLIISPDIQAKCSLLEGELQLLMDAHKDRPQSLRSEEDISSATLRTTVIAQKVHLSKYKAELSKEDAAYTEILRSLTSQLEELFAKYLIDPTDLPFHEIFLYDLKSPNREVFTPRPRHAVERALASPHDYLDCECCIPKPGESEEGSLAASQPSTSVLYQLYLESGNLINLSDLWLAYLAVMGSEQGEEQTMALFQRGLAELRHLGMVKSTRKRVDHVAKVAWRGL